MPKALWAHDQKISLRGEIWKLHGNDGSLSSSPISQPHRINKTLRIRGLIISTSSTWIQAGRSQGLKQRKLTCPHQHK
ncbi:hypothetical protein V2G26_000500 [Clonostachys chloroleuca]